MCCIMRNNLVDGGQNIFQHFIQVEFGSEDDGYLAQRFCQQALFMLGSFCLLTSGDVTGNFDKTTQFARLISKLMHDPAGEKTTAIFADMPAFIFGASLSHGLFNLFFRNPLYSIFRGKNDSTALTECL